MGRTGIWAGNVGPALPGPSRLTPLGGSAFNSSKTLLVTSVKKMLPILVTLKMLMEKKEGEKEEEDGSDDIVAQSKVKIGYMAISVIIEKLREPF